MITRKAFVGASALYNIFFFPFSSCHMEMSWPYALRSKFNPANTYQNIDYSMTSPLSANGSDFPCKGYQNDRPVQTVIEYTAGSTYNMTLAGSATHGGGSCQLSLSYDNGATFRVIKSMIGGCPLTDTYDFTIPSYAPPGVALFAWTWQNYEGNREFYMNCAEVNVVSTTSTRRRKRQSYTGFDQLPYIWKANLEGVSDCVTTEQEDPVYPNPGPDVIYGDGLTSSSTPSSGDCDAPTPYGQTYQDLGDSTQPAPSSPDQSNTSTTAMLTTYPSFSYAPTDISTEESLTTYPTLSYAPVSTSDATTATISSDTIASAGTAPVARQVSTESYSTTTITIDCPATVTMTIYPSASTTSTVTLPPSPTSPTFYTTAVSACTGTSASCPCASNYQCQELSPCTWACNAYVTATTFASSASAQPSPRTTSSSRKSRSTWTTRTWTTHSTWNSHTWSSHSTWSSRSRVVVTTTHTVTPVQPTTTAGAGQQGHSPYASGDLSRYLPCVPGKFICTDDSTWQTCNYPDGSDPNTPSNAWVYGYPRDVAAGMECITFLSPYSSETRQYAQQALTPNGYFRDDRIVRARPDGDCDDDGSLKCIDNGQQFEICDQGGWVLMGAVANGTTCSNGAIVASS